MSLSSMTTASQAAPSLRLEGYGVSFGDRVVLSSIDLEVVGGGTCVLMGPAGTGKSTLLRSLAGFNESNPGFRSWGRAWINGAPLDADNRPALIAQSARLVMADVLSNLMHEHPDRGTLSPVQQRSIARLTLQRAGMEALAERLDAPMLQLSLLDQRRIALLRLLAGGPPAIFLDEPTTALEPAEAELLLEHIRTETARHRELLSIVVLHNQQQAKAIGREVALLASGEIQEHAATGQFFAHPASEAARQFVRTGSCSTLPPPGEPGPRPVNDERGPLRARANAASQAHGPTGFLWLWRGMLAGTPMPGVVQEIDYDMNALQRVGVTILVTLTETPLPREALDTCSIGNLWFPIPDMEAPDPEDAGDLCDRIIELVDAGEVLAVHCLAGLGRTGTILACCLIRSGHSAEQALEAVRAIQPRWVQSPRQEQFLEEFARHCAMQNG